MSTVWQSSTSLGRLFQSLEPAARNVRSPMVASCTLGTSSRCVCTIFRMNHKHGLQRRRRHCVASSGRHVAPPWPRRMACLQRLAGTDPVSLRSWSVQRARGQPGRRLQSLLSEPSDARPTWQCRSTTGYVNYACEWIEAFSVFDDDHCYYFCQCIVTRWWRQWKLVVCQSPRCMSRHQKAQQVNSLSLQPVQRVCID